MNDSKNFPPNSSTDAEKAEYQASLSLSDEELRDLASGHPADTVSLSQIRSTGSGKTTFATSILRIGRKANVKAIEDAQKNHVPYYRQYDKRK
jgi:hypothetical protein